MNDSKNLERKKEANDSEEERREKKAQPMEKTKENKCLASTSRKGGNSNGIRTVAALLSVLVLAITIVRVHDDH